MIYKVYISNLEWMWGRYKMGILMMGLHGQSDIVGGDRCE